MPFQTASLSTPASTTKASLNTVQVPLPAGVITWVGVLFPLGCAGLAHARILRSNHQIWPADLDADLASNGLVVSWDEHYPVLDTPHELLFHTWSDDDTYPHTLTLYVEIEDPSISIERREAAGFLGRLRQLLGL
jgi:hypothetical protein